MKETYRFLVPDYFPAFACKMGACRTACCTGWPVTVSQENYFHLLGVSCSAELRHRIDCGLHPVDYPTPDEFARFEHRYDGECAARLPDGRCAIHAELGEDILADVCRLYPRGIRRAEDGGYECSCANSCEAVIEGFFAHPTPLRFTEHTMTLVLPRLPARSVHFPTFGHAWEIRLRLIALLQDRSHPLPCRLIQLGQAVAALEASLNANDAGAIAAWLQMPISAPPAPAADIEAQLTDGLPIVGQLLDILGARSDSIRRQGEIALAYFGHDDGALSRYRTAREGFEHRFPDHALRLEHMLVNHMYFTQFPFTDRPETVSDEFVALCAVYALLCFLLLGCAPQTDAEFADLAAALFRLVEHTDFDRTAVRLLHRLSCTTEHTLWGLIAL